MGGHSINFRCFKDIDNDVFKEDLVNAPWDRVLSCHDVNEAWSLWHSLFMSIINHHALMKSKRIRGDSLPWLDGKILQLMRQRDCVVMPPLVILKYTTVSINFFITQSMSNACCPT